MAYSIDKKTVDHALFEFHKSIYLFERRESLLFGVTWDEVFLLQLLKRSPGLTVSHLSQRLRVKNFVTSRMLTRLEKDGLVKRQGCHPDKRVVIVAITPSGLEKLASIEAYHYETVSAQFEQLPELQLRMVLESISQLSQILNLEGEEA